MIKEVDNLTFASQAVSAKYDSIPYNTLDCQGFVEKVLADCGVRKADGEKYNWRGSNSMWRNALSWKGTISECLRKFGGIPLGAWVFIIKNDGGEKEKGYNDDQGNASHVGIFCREYGNEQVRDSTRSTKLKRDGVGYRSIDSFTHVGLPYMISFTDNSLTLNKETVSREEALKALETLKLYILGG